MSEFSKKDQVFSRPFSEVKAFEFNQQVSEVFDDMINRSVPGYDLLLKLAVLTAEFCVETEGRVYDLGCSTGMMSRVIAMQLVQRSAEIIAVDNAPAMINLCKQRHAELPVQFVCDDITDYPLDACDLVLLNLTLQFVDPSLRTGLMKNIYNALKPGGAVFLTEKVKVEGTKGDVVQELYQGFKKLQGYSDLEISQKRTALEHVLIPETHSSHVERLKDCGFNNILELFHCFNFVCFVAIK